MRACMRRVVTATRIAGLGMAAVLGAAGPAGVGAQGPPPPAAASASTLSQATGRVGGRVVDATSGQPIAGVQVMVGANLAVATTDLDGRYRTTPVAVGVHRVLARRLGLQPRQYDSITVRATETAIVNFSMSSAAVSLTAVVVSAERANAATSEAGLLSMQQRAASATDGISAEQIKRAPDADASQAAVRVPGVSVVDNKYVVVRGLSERYSNTLLNGVEVTSPEPSKKIVPLDIFPSSLLEAIVVTKSATPDKPGDFSGGSVEIRTKEFPEQFIFQYSLSAGWNSLTTGRELQMPQWRGMDFLGFDDGKRRQRPAYPDDFDDPTKVERFMESLRNTWNPRPRPALPNLGLSVNLGDQRQGKSSALGYVASLTYNARQENQPERYFQFISAPSEPPIRSFRYNERRASVDWGGVLNVSYRLGTNHKFGLKNLYTRGAEESYNTNEGYNLDQNGDLRGFQMAYVSRDLLQSQLTGEHLGKLLVPWRLEWKATVSRSTRDEPDNRQVRYLRPPTDSIYYLGLNSDLWFRFLDDQLRTGNLDLGIPLPWWGGRDVMVKTGVLARQKDRAFDAQLASLNIEQVTNPPRDLAALPPERLFLPENLGQYLNITFPGSVAQPYDADDDLYAAYGMLDLPLFSFLRIVGGMRVEDWRMDLFDGGRELYQIDTTRAPTARRNRDYLWSVNTTWSLSSRMNLRAAAFRSLARPDTREMSRDEYIDVIGSCPSIGNPSLQRSLITNGDLRWEWYPGPGEIVALSGFYKSFERPILRVTTGDQGCRYTWANGREATNIGGEIDLRKGLWFLPGVLNRLSIGGNAAYVHSRVTVDPNFGTYDADLALEDQSPWLVNANLSFVDEARGVDASVLYNWFDDRINRYGFRGTGGTNATQGPNIVEKGRSTLDAKLQLRIGAGFIFSVSARNLTNNTVEFYQDAEYGRISTGFFRPGRSVGITIGRGR
jgi:hypothetical protein